MRKRGIAAVAIALLGMLAVTGAVLAHGGAPVSTEMTGAAEVPGPGDPDGTGTASFTINPGLGELCFELTVQNIAPATAAHIHVAPAGVAGPVIVPLTPPTNGSSSGCREISRELALAIIQNPDAYYANVHNADFPAGAVRGQLSLP
jgi:CHRD domain